MNLLPGLEYRFSQNNLEGNPVCHARPIPDPLP